MEIWDRIIWKHFESGVPHGHENLFVCNCVCSRLHFLCLCVSCVCSVLSPGTSAMPPLSQFLTSLLKNMLIQTNLPFLLSSPILLLGWTGRDRRSSLTARLFDFSLPFFSFFILLFQIISSPNRLHERWWGSMEAISYVLLYCTANVGSWEKIIIATAHGGSHQKVPDLPSINHQYCCSCYSRFFLNCVRSV